jgi:hypothetical protein
MVVALTGRLRRKILVCKFLSIFAGIQTASEAKEKPAFLFEAVFFNTHLKFLPLPHMQP